MKDCPGGTELKQLSEVRRLIPSHIPGTATKHTITKVSTILGLIDPKITTTPLQLLDHVSPDPPTGHISFTNCSSSQTSPVQTTVRVYITLKTNGMNQIIFWT
ncbi:hypothetical protein EMCRGX_G001806 [Ephydatia muelleri]